jgi:sn-glycerol 3-phosphate transport system substrate-binding protein
MALVYGFYILAAGMTRTLLLTLLVWAAPLSAQAAIEIRVWHALAGAPGTAFEALVARFNASQNSYRVVTLYMGSAPLEAALAAAASKRVPSQRVPHLVQAGEARSAALTAQPRGMRPLWEVLAHARQGTPAYAPALAAPFSDAQGRLLALPLGASTPVLYYNQDAFRRARIDPGPALRTWYEVANTLGALIESGERCGFTSAWPAWVLLENMAAWHNEPFAYEEGAAEGAAHLSFNGQLMVRWVAMLASWQKSGYFTYAGRENEGEARFAAGECMVLTSSSASYASLQERARFGVAVAPLPYYDDFSAAPQNTLVRGSALWVLDGRAAEEYAGVARFVGFLSEPRVQAEWHQNTGFIPLTRIAYELTRAQGFYRRNPGYEVAVRQVLIRAPTKVSATARFGELPRIRSIIDEELESVWGGKKTAIDSLNAAVSRGNAVLKTGAR